MRRHALVPSRARRADKSADIGRAAVISGAAEGTRTLDIQLGKLNAEGVSARKASVCDPGIPDGSDDASDTSMIRGVERLSATEAQELLLLLRKLSRSTSGDD